MVVVAAEAVAEVDEVAWEVVDVVVAAVEEAAGAANIIFCVFEIMISVLLWS